MGCMRTGRTTAKDGHPRLAALGTSCPDHVLRTKVRPMVLDLPPDAPLEAVEARLRKLHAAAELREESGLDPDPVAAYQRSGYPEKIVADRGGRRPAGDPEE